MSSNRWIIIPVEVQRRELDAKLVVAALAAGRGYKVLIGQDRIVRRLARFLPKGIMFDKGIAGKGDKKVYRYNRLGFRYALMDEEGTGFIVDPVMFLEARMSDDTLHLCDRFFCISDTVRDICIDHFPKHKAKFVTTGLCRTDTWRKPMVGLYDAGAQKIRDQFGRFVLFNSNFGLVNHARGEEYVNKQISRVEAVYDPEAADYERQINENQLNFQAYIDVLPKILNWLPEHNIVIRPHPAENVEFWKDKFKDEPRIFVEDEGVVTQWILASEFMLHHGCTTGIEAEILGHKQVNYAPYPDHWHDTDMARSFSQFVHSEDELRKVMLKSINDNQHTKTPAEGQERYFASLEGKLVADKILDEFDDISFESSPLSEFLWLLRFTPRHIASAFKDLRGGAKAYSEQKFGGVSEEELNQKLQFISDASGFETPAKASQVFHNLFCVENS